MISLAGRDILHGWSKYVLTGLGLGLLIGVTLTMAGVYRGMVDDAHALLANSRADLWVVQKDTQGPYAESSSIKDDVVRSMRGMPGVAAAANVAYLTMQVGPSWLLPPLLALATWRHQGRVRTNGSDRSWYVSWRRSTPRTANK